MVEWNVMQKLIETHLIRVASLNWFPSICLVNIFKLTVLLGTCTITSFKAIGERPVVIHDVFLRNDWNVFVFIISQRLLLLLLGECNGQRHHENDEKFHFYNLKFSLSEKHSLSWNWLQTQLHPTLSSYALFIEHVKWNIRIGRNCNETCLLSFLESPTISINLNNISKRAIIWQQRQWFPQLQLLTVSRRAHSPLLSQETSKFLVI